MLISVVKSCTLTQSIYCFCLGRSDFQMYRFYNCFLGLKAWQGIGSAFLAAYCFLFVEFTVSDWVSTLYITLFSVMQFARSQAILEPRRKKTKRNNEMQLNSFADIFLSHFIHRVWTPGVLQPFWNSKANAEGTPSWELATIKKFVKTFLALRLPMFPGVSGKLTHSRTRADPKERSQIQWISFLAITIWLQHGSL